MKQFFVLGMLLSTTLAFGQRAFEGTVHDARTGEPIPLAVITAPSLSNQVLSDDNGRFSFETDSRSTITVNAFGYVERKIRLDTVPGTLRVTLNPTSTMLADIEVYALRATGESPLAVTEMDRDEISERNSGRDMAYVLEFTPSIVTTSDAGTGIGYTGMRIRGSDNTRINVTVNGIPINDAESHGVFWVNMPDLASSASSIQIQRGVGSSTNGAGAFGASINVATASLNPEPFGEVTTGYGSFNSFRRSVQLGTGLINDHWAFEGRLSQITSDGFIDRASSDLRSYYLSGGYFAENTVVKLVHFTGRERTYQAWWGIPEAKLKGDAQGIEDHIVNNGLDSADAHNLRTSGNRTYNYYTYENEVDNYGQDHYQLHWNQQWSPGIRSNFALHYTRGLGYYEQFRKDDDFSDYGLEPLYIGNDTINSTDLIRRRWLDNHFYGAVYGVTYKAHNARITLGGAYNEYTGLHYGELRWMEYTNGTSLGDHYYDNDAMKRDFNTYLKGEIDFGRFTAYGDIQVRTIGYSTQGIDNDLVDIDVQADFTFFNPKAGLNYALTDQSHAYASVAVANREPVRNDFIDAPDGQTPLPERLIDYEAGYRISGSDWAFEGNLFYMDYENQLVLTGELNDVGAVVRTNVPQSWRTGAELQFAWRPIRTLEVRLNSTFSQNRIRNFTEVLYDYTSGFDVVENNYEETDISYSPNFVGAGTLAWRPMENLKLAVNVKSVGRQYLDNTSNADRSLDPYTTTDFQLTYTWIPKGVEGIDLSLLVINALNVEYEPNGYTYSYIYGSMITENFYYPMAGTQLMGTLTVRF